MRVLQVGLGSRSYPIKISPGSIDLIPDDILAIKDYAASHYCIVADDNVSELYGNRLLELIRSRGVSCDMLVFPHGEENKTLATIEDLAGRAARTGLDRKSMIIALGGGVVGDVGGFLAASYMRGVPFIQVPTTLLAQVDSSVGGKTGVDIPEGKNLVGAFYQPKAVYVDTDVLKSLPETQILSGLAEVIKYGIIGDWDFLDFLRSNREAILSLRHDLVEEIVYTCCKIKADIVEEDELESDRRRILNYGHTLGHAVEATSEFKLFHGLAVAIGMVAAARISLRKGLLTPQRYREMFDIISGYGLPTEVPRELDRNTIKSYLLTDKKNIAGKIFYILAKEDGTVDITDDVSNEDVDAVLDSESQWN